jgi:adenylyl-sulfate kinase
MRKSVPACVIWLTGISGSGKTTLGIALKKVLEKKYPRLEFLDGDEVRSFFGNDLGYSRPERVLNVKRIAFAAMLLAKHGIPVIVANIAPYYEARDFIRKKIPGYLQVYVKVSVEEARRRDPKGHYRRHDSGQVCGLVGIDDIYDVPRNPDIVIDTEKETVTQSVEKIMRMLAKKGF